MQQTSKLQAACCGQSLLATRQLFEAAEAAATARPPPPDRSWLGARQANRLAEFSLLEAELWWLPPAIPPPERAPCSVLFSILMELDRDTQSAVVNRR